MINHKTLSSVFALALLAAPAAQAERFNFGRNSEFTNDGMYYAPFSITLDYVVGYDSYHYGTDIQVPHPEDPMFYGAVLDVLTDFLSVRPVNVLDDMESYNFQRMINDIAAVSTQDAQLLVDDLGIDPQDWQQAEYKAYRYEAMLKYNGFIESLRSPYMHEQAPYFASNRDFIDQVNQQVQDAQAKYPHERAFQVPLLTHDDLDRMRRNFATNFVYDMQNVFNRSDYGGGHGAYELEGRKIDALIGGAIMLYPQYFSGSTDIVLYDGVMSRFEGKADLEAMNEAMPDYLEDALRQARMNDNDIHEFHSRVVEWLNYYDRRRVIPQPAP